MIIIKCKHDLLIYQVTYVYTFKIASVTHLHIKWQAWLNTIG